MTHRPSVIDSYLDAKHAVVLAGYWAEIDWQANLAFDDATESTFLSEAAWVILSSGFRERAVRSLFPRVSRAFLEWSSAQAIVRNRRKCVANALIAFGHVGKVDAIAIVAERVADLGFARFAAELRADPIAFLQTLPYLGPVTSIHLAKNLGFDVVKPDRHLARISLGLGFPGPDELCTAISDVVGDPLSVVDIVFWRFATLFPDYMTRLSGGSGELG